MAPGGLCETEDRQHSDGESNDAPTESSDQADIPNRLEKVRSESRSQQRSKIIQIPAHYETHYENPTAVSGELDGPRESLAKRIQKFGIPIPMARGFIQDYGFDLAEAAAINVESQDADNPAGLFRYLLQLRYADRSVPQAKTNGYTTDQYSDFIQS